MPPIEHVYGFSPRKDQEGAKEGIVSSLKKSFDDLAIPFPNNGRIAWHRLQSNEQDLH